MMQGAEWKDNNGALSWALHLYAETCVPLASRAMLKRQGTIDFSRFVLSAISSLLDIRKRLRKPSPKKPQIIFDFNHLKSKLNVIENAEFLFVIWRIFNDNFMFWCLKIIGSSLAFSRKKGGG